MFILLTGSIAPSPGAPAPVSEDVSWVEALSAISSAVAALLSIAAVAVTVYVARVASKQSRDLASEQEHRESSAFLSSWKQDVLAHGKAALLAARKIEALTSPRLSELLSEHPMKASESADLRREVRHLLADLRTEVALLRAIDTTIGPDLPLPAERFAGLLNEAAWMETDATHLAFLAFSGESDDDDESVDLHDEDAVVDALMNGSFVNLNPRLLAECADMNADDVPSWGEPGSPWKSIYDKREKLLRGHPALRGSWKPSSLAEAATRSLSLTTDRFEDALVRLLRELGPRS
uniref:hypothetical protein n=1 Tax=Microbacterium sp. SORGH_AS_1204 TaxID=3041785 RepID=UPI0027D8F372|nr:hypothetical protein [Microbacterium sp. SORGH_AS_1204]